MQLLSQSIGDIAAMAEMCKTKEDIANAFHVPLAFLTTQTNLALPAGRREPAHAEDDQAPRRLFLASEDPSPVDPEMTWQMMRINMQFGVVTINEARDA